MRILFANATAEIGGAEQVILSIAERLPAYGVEPSFALLQSGPLVEALRRRGFNVDVFPETYRFRNLPTLNRCVRWLTDLLRKNRIDLVHSNLTAHLISSWAAKGAHVPEVWHLHDYPYKFDPVHMLNRCIPADFYIFTTEFLKSGEPWLSRRPHAVINPDCIDVGRLRCAPDSSFIMQHLGVEPGRYFLTVSRLQSHKGHTYLLDAAARVTEQAPLLKFVIAGKATGCEQKAYLDRLKSRVQRLGLEQNVVFAGFVADEDMPTLYRNAYVLVHPAVTEGYGLVLLEAMCHGTPVIAAAASGPAEIVQNERNGLLVPIKDGTALANAMLRLLQTGRWRRRSRNRQATTSHTRL